MKLSTSSARLWICSWSAVFFWKAKFNCFSLMSIRVASIPFLISSWCTIWQTLNERESGLRELEIMSVFIG